MTATLALVAALSLTQPALTTPPGAPVAGGVPAAHSTRVHLSVGEAVDDALENAPALAAAAALARAARAKADAVARGRWGQVDAVALYSRYQDDQAVRPFSLQLLGQTGFVGLPWDRDQVHYGLTFQLPLYLGGRLAAAAEASHLQADQAALLVEGSRWEVRANAMALYAGAQALDAVAGAVDQTLAALDATRQKVSLMVDQGRRPGLDLLKLDEEIADARTRRTTVAAERVRVRGLLLALVGRDPSLPLDVDPLPPGEPQLTIVRADLAGLVDASSPVRRTDLGVTQAAAGVRAARGAMLPTVALRGDVMANYGASLGEQFGTWDVSLAVTFPLFDGGARHADLAAARETERAADQAAVKVRLDRQAQLVEAIARLDASREAVTAARARVAAAAEAARIEQIRYDTGAGAVDDLLRARARELSAASVLAQARGDEIAAAGRVNAIVEKEVVR
jgi:outer membrane protein TolC